MSDPTPGTESYWSDLDQVEDPTRLQLLQRAHRDLDEPEDMVAAIATGTENGLLYVLTISEKERSGHTIVTMRYATVDDDEREAALGQNRIRMRKQGSLLPALKVALAAYDDGAAVPESPMDLDARSESGIDHAANVLNNPLGPRSTDDEDDEDEVEEDPDRVECVRCEETLPIEEAEDFGDPEGDLGHMWVHAGGCP